MAGSARINALAASLRCLCWFNPLIHLGAAWMRTDQELACDAAVVAGSIRRRDYANALVKSQMLMTALPLGCNWPGSQHPLIERIALLERRGPSRGRRIAGMGLILLAGTSAGMGAWAAQPPVPAKSAAESGNGMALATRPAVTAAPAQDGGNTGQPAAGAIAAGGDASLPPPLVARLIPANTLAVPPADLARLAPVTPQLVASNDPPVAPAQAASQAQAATVTAQNRQPGDPDAAQAAAAAGCAPPKLVNSVPLEMVNGGPVMSVAATFNNTPLRMLIDIGRSPMRLWESAADKLHLANQGAFYFDFAGRFSQRSSRVEDVKLGSMEGGGFHVLITKDPNTAEAPFDGIIGNEIAIRYDVDLDFAHQKMNFFTPEKCEGAGIYWSPGTITSVPIVAFSGVAYGDRSPVPRLDTTYVPVTLDGHVFVALLDTSADRTFINPEVADKVFGLKPESLEATGVNDGGTLIKSAGLRTFAPDVWRRLTASNVRVAVPLDVKSENTRILSRQQRSPRDSFYLHEIMPDMVIGMDILRHAHLYVAFQSARVYVSAAGDGPALAAAAPTETTWFNVPR